jgi:hypothetical protein
MRTVAFDGLNSLKVPDSDRNRGWNRQGLRRTATSSPTAAADHAPKLRPGVQWTPTVGP